MRELKIEAYPGTTKPEDIEPERVEAGHQRAKVLIRHEGAENFTDEWYYFDGENSEFGVYDVAEWAFFP
jgi:hypothetical protein